MTTNTTKSVRLLSLDFLRGFIMVLLALDACELYSNIRKGIPDKDSIGGKVITLFFHNNWEGLHFWDLVQPAFMFMAGIAMAYSLTAQNSKAGTVYGSAYEDIKKIRLAALLGDL